jgi:hypothetical protein
MKLYMFRTVPLSIISSYSLYTQQWYMSYRQISSSSRNQNVPSWSCSKAVYKPVWHIPLLSVQWIIPDDGQGNCPKHIVSFQNKFEKSVHLVGFIIRKFVTMRGSHERTICHDAPSHVTMRGHMNVQFVTMHRHMSRCTVTWTYNLYASN